MTPATIYLTIMYIDGHVEFARQAELVKVPRVGDQVADLDMYESGVITYEVRTVTFPLLGDTCDQVWIHLAEDSWKDQPEITAEIGSAEMEDCGWTKLT